MGDRATVLIVEDNMDNRRIYADILRASGYEVLEAEDGAEGVEQARRHDPNLILMDISMPRMDGWTAIGELKRDPTTARIPVMALTAHVPLKGERERSREAGFESYLLKPLVPKDLLHVVEERLDG